MPNVEINPTAAVAFETPSGAIIKAAAKTATVRDSLGRAITIRRLSPVFQQRLRAMAGPELSKNEVWFGWSALAFSVTAINGDPVLANSLRELEALTEQLDIEGLEAVSSGIVSTWGQANGPSESVDAIKN